MNWLMFCVWGLPIVLALGALVMGVVEYRKARKEGTGRRNALGPAVTGWNAVVLVIASILATIQANIEDLENRIDQKFAELPARVKEVNEPSGFQILTVHKPEEAMIAIKKSIDELYDRGGGIRRFTRAVFHTGPAIGTRLEDDFLLGDRLPALGFPVSYIVGYPSAAELASDDLSLRSRRKQMQRYLFAILASPEWQSEAMRGLQGSFCVYYVPFNRSFDSWELAGNGGVEGGQVFLRGGWIGDSERPVPTTVLRTNRDFHCESISEDNAAMRLRAVRFIRHQQSLPLHSREPCMVFCTDDVANGLRPLTISELEEQVAVWRHGAGRSSETLGELDELLQYVKGLYGVIGTGK